MGAHAKSAYSVLASQRWIGTSLACMAFTFFVVGRPATWRLALEPEWAKSAEWWWMMQMVPPALVVSRFTPHPIFNYGHLLLGGLWVLFAPLQLNPWLRRTYPAVHRWCGRGMLMGSLAIIGTVIYWEAMGKLAEHGIHAWTFYRPTLIGFTGTAVMAMAAAMQRRWTAHGAWMTAHVAFGMPFGWGRLLAPLFIHAYALLGVDLSNPLVGLRAFWVMTYTMTTLCWVLAGSVLLRARAAARSAAPAKRA